MGTPIGNFRGGHTLAVKSEGSVVAWGNTHSGATTIAAGLPAAIAVSAGDGFTMAIVRDPPPAPTFVRNANHTFTLSWSGAGTLEQTESLATPNWQPAQQPKQPADDQRYQPNTVVPREGGIALSITEYCATNEYE
jgi:hypothetical protein